MTAQHWPHVLHKAFAAMKRLLAWKNDVRRAKLCLRASTSKVGSTGHVSADDRITVTAGSDVADALETLMHELAHVAFISRYPDKRDWHGDTFYAILFDASRELIGEEYIHGVRKAAKDHYSHGRGRTASWALDHELAERYRRALYCGVFDSVGLADVVQTWNPTPRLKLT